MLCTFVSMLMVMSKSKLNLFFFLFIYFFFFDWTVQSHGPDDLTVPICEYIELHIPRDCIRQSLADLSLAIKQVRCIRTTIRVN